MTNTETHRAFWESLGAKMNRHSIAEVFVTRCEVSRSGEGTFIVVNEEGRPSVKLRDQEKFRADLTRLGVQIRQLEEYVDGLKTMDSSFKISFDGIKPEFFDQAKPLRQILANIISRVPSALPLKMPVNITGSVENVPVPSGLNPIIAAAKRGQKKVTFILRFENFLDARQQAKSWSSASQTAVVLNDYGGITITGGMGWSAKQIRAYTANY